MKNTAVKRNYMPRTLLKINAFKCIEIMLVIYCGFSICLCFAFVSIMDNDPFIHKLGGVLLKFQILLSPDELCLRVRCKL